MLVSPFSDTVTVTSNTFVEITHEDFDNALKGYLSNLNESKRIRSIITLDLYNYILRFLFNNVDVTVKVKDIDNSNDGNVKTYIYEGYKYTQSTALIPSKNYSELDIWIKCNFSLMFDNITQKHLVCYEGLPIVPLEYIFNVMVKTHIENDHCGRDKLTNLIRSKWRFIPKDLIARFIKCCNECNESRRKYYNKKRRKNYNSIGDDGKENRKIV